MADPYERGDGVWIAVTLADGSRWRIWRAGTSYAAAAQLLGDDIRAGRVEPAERDSGEPRSHAFINDGQIVSFEWAADVA